MEDGLYALTFYSNSSILRCSQKSESLWKNGKKIRQLIITLLPKSKFKGGFDRLFFLPYFLGLNWGCDIKPILPFCFFGNLSNYSLPNKADQA